MSQQSSVFVEDLTKIYEPSPLWMRALVRSNIDQPVVALDGVSFEVSPGEICVVLGPNGAGKTTTFRILVGLTTPTSGIARVMGNDPETEALRVRRLIGWMPGDQRSLLLRHSVEENLRFHGKLQGMSGEELTRAVRDVLKLVGLQKRAKNTGFSLSAGMKARLQLARALLHHPRVLILDEPTGAVDPVASTDLVELILDIVAKREIAALISSHRLEEIERLHSRVLMMDKGKLRYDGPLDKLRTSHAATRIEIAFPTKAMAADAANRLTSAGVGDLVEHDGKAVSFVVHAGVNTAKIIEVLGPLAEHLDSLEHKEPPLHTVLAHIYGSGEPAAGGGTDGN